MLARRLTAMTEGFVISKVSTGANAQILGNDCVNPDHLQSF